MKALRDQGGGQRPLRLVQKQLFDSRGGFTPGLRGSSSRQIESDGLAGNIWTLVLCCKMPSVPGMKDAEQKMGIVSPPDCGSILSSW